MYAMFGSHINPDQIRPQEFLEGQVATHDLSIDCSFSFAFSSVLLSNCEVASQPFVRYSMNVSGNGSRDREIEAHRPICGKKIREQQGSPSYFPPCPPPRALSRPLARLTEAALKNSPAAATRYSLFRCVMIGSSTNMFSIFT